MRIYEPKGGWESWRRKHPFVFRIIVVLKKIRTKVASTLVLLCLAEMVYNHEAPFDLDHHIGKWVVIGSCLILAGLAFRLSALGCLRKKRLLATHGVYSLCRHPLYVGSLLLASGFCVLLRDVTAWAFASAYFLIFYPLTMAWEEIRLTERFGEDWIRYREETPAILPLGRFKPGPWSCRLAAAAGGWQLTLLVLLMLAVVETMAETIR